MWAVSQIGMNFLGATASLPPPKPVLRLPQAIGMTYEEFAGHFRFSVNTLSHRGQGYLLVIDRAPKAVQKALHAA